MKGYKWPAGLDKGNLFASWQDVWYPSLIGFAFKHLEISLVMSNIYLAIQRISAIFVLIFCLAVSTTYAQTGADLFPIYPCIQKNVAFWEKIYSDYPTSTGLIHDSRDLDIVYEVITFDTDEDGRPIANEPALKDTKEKYRNLLIELANGRPAVSSEEERVLALFGGHPQPERLLEAAENIRFQRGQTDRFLTGVIRSGAYIDRIKEIFRARGLPEELAFLPHVESSFDTSAYSKCGAAGIWQFTRGTGRRYLTIDSILDERLDPIRSSEAAAGYLEGSFAALESWPLAITSYNHGINGMKRAKELLGDYETILQQYDGKLFGFASRNFYAEFLAALKVAKNYEHYFGPQILASPPSYQEIELPGYMSATDLVGYFRITEDLFRTYNPGLGEQVIMGRKYIPKGYRVRLPMGLNRTTADIPLALLHDQQKTPQISRALKSNVSKGDPKIILASLSPSNDLTKGNSRNSNQGTAKSSDHGKGKKTVKKAKKVGAQKKKTPAAHKGHRLTIAHQ